MKGKLNPFSIYLLKPNVTPVQALEPENPLKEMKGDKLPQGSILFVNDGKPKPTWWSEYLDTLRAGAQIIPMHDRLGG